MTPQYRATSIAYRADRRAIHVPNNNLIKMHKDQLASDRTSCQSPLASQLRLVLHTGAYWLMLALRDTIPRATPLARAEFASSQATPAQDRRPRHRKGLPNPHPLHIGLPGHHPLPPTRRPSRRSAPLSAGATCPDHPGSFTGPVQSPITIEGRPTLGYDTIAAAKGAADNLRNQKSVLIQWCLLIF